MKEGDTIAKHLNSFNLILSQLASIDILVEEEDKHIMLIFSLPKSWEKIILAITAKFLEDPKMDALIEALLAQEMRRKAMDSQGDALNVRGRPKERGCKGDKNGPKDKSKGRSKTFGKKNRVKCWNYGKRGHVKKECKNAKKQFDSSTKKSSNSGDNALISSLHVMNKENQLIALG